MTGEQEKNEASELVRTLLDPTPSEAFSLWRVDPLTGKRKEHRIRIRLLSCAERDQVLVCAQQHASEVGELSKVYQDIYQEAQAVELLARAICTTELKTRADGTKYFRPLFVSAKQLRESFTKSEMALCLNMHEVVEAKYSSFEYFSPADIDEWASRLSDPLLGDHFLALLDSSRWPELAMRLAHQVRSLSEKAGLPLRDWRDSLESELEISDSATISSIGSPSAAFSEGKQLAIPSDNFLEPPEAKSLSDENDS